MAAWAFATFWVVVSNAIVLGLPVSPTLVHGSQKRQRQRHASRTGVLSPIVSRSDATRVFSD